MMSRCKCLTRYWIDVAEWTGYGVTATSESEALRLARDVAAEIHEGFTVISVTPNVDVQALDTGHVIPNMGPPSNYGVWFPRRNL